jgi:hypothetical protein
MELSEVAGTRVKVWGRLLREARDLLELVLVPGLAAVLPWPICFALFKQLARWRWLYREECVPALGQAVQRELCHDAAAWAFERRLTTLLDHADHYLFRTRTDAWMRRYVDVNGAWDSSSQAGLLWTFHWGAGLWALRHARVSGLHANMILAAPGGADFVGRTVFGCYVRARMRSVHLALERAVIFVPGGMRALRKVLEQREQVAVVMDVPQDQVNVVRTTEILDQPVSVPAVLSQMAVDKGLPVTVYFMGIDLRTGRRVLHVEPLGVWTDPKALTDAAFSHLDRLLRTSPAAWHLWAQAPRFFKARETCADSSSNALPSSRNYGFND